MQRDALVRGLIPFFMLLFVLTAVDWGVLAGDAEARPRSGGRSFRAPAQQQQQAPRRQNSEQMQQNRGTHQQNPGFGRGLLGGLMGGALGAMLFGSLFGMGGSGMGILPLLLLGVAGYFFYRRFMRGSAAGYQGAGGGGSGMANPRQGESFTIPPIQDIPGPDRGLAAIRRTDPDFDEAHFLEVASDVFFKVQAGWMRRDLSALRHLLGQRLADEYAQHFKEMKEKGQLNKLESIAIRKVEIVDAGSDGTEDYVTVLFTANLLDYIVDERTGDVVEGSMSEPVKFAEEWTWARPVRTDRWLLEGIQAVEG